MSEQVTLSVSPMRTGARYPQHAGLGVEPRSVVMLPGEVESPGMLEIPEITLMNAPCGHRLGTCVVLRHHSIIQGMLESQGT